MQSFFVVGRPACVSLFECAFFFFSTRREFVYLEFLCVFVYPLSYVWLIISTTYNFTTEIFYVQLKYNVHINIAVHQRKAKAERFVLGH